MSNGVDVLILAEDERHRMLLRKHLRRRGYTHRRIRDHPWWPAFETPCLSFVKAQYPNQVQALRDKSHRVTAALVVVVDADHKTLESRLKEMDDLLPTADKPRRGPDENIAIVVARRNIETWMFFLTGNEVDEETDYKPRCRSLDNSSLALAFANLSWPRQPMPEDCPASLQHACEVELPRLP